MDPWSKVDYSRLIREALMVVEKLPEVNPPSDRVPGQGLLEAPILESRRRWNREEMVKRVLSRRFSRRGVNIGQRGAKGVAPGVQVATWRGHRGVAPPGRLEPWWPPSGPPSG